MQFSKEDFESWLAHPVTEEVFKAFEMLGEQAKQAWIEKSWGSGNCDPLILADLRARVEVVEDFRKIDFETLREWLDDKKE